MPTQTLTTKQQIVSFCDQLVASTDGHRFSGYITELCVGEKHRVVVERLENGSFLILFRYTISRHGIYYLINHSSGKNPRIFRGEYRHTLFRRKFILRGSGFVKLRLSQGFFNERCNEKQLSFIQTILERLLAKKRYY